MMRFVLIFLLSLNISGFSGQKILFVGGIPEGDEHVIFAKNIPGSINNVFYESLCDLVQNLNKREISVNFIENFNFCKRFNRHTKQWKSICDAYDLFIFFDKPPYLNRHVEKNLGHKSIMILTEPPTVIPNQYRKQNIQGFSQILTWNDPLVDHQKYKKFMLPVYLPYLGGNSFSDRRMCALMCGNKSSSHEKELYSKRREIIDFFKEDLSIFELYGPGWENAHIPTYKGSVPFKYDVLSQVRFNICIENTADFPGYITEKIFDALHAGAIPIYYGGASVDQYIPKDCYIDLRDFSRLEELKAFMQNFTEQEFLDYQMRIRRFLSSDAAKVFSAENFSNLLLEVILEAID